MNLAKLLQRRSRPDESAERSSTEAEPSASIVAGERSVSATQRVRSTHSRLTQTLAVGIAAVVFAVALVWYYQHAFAVHARERENARSALAQKAQADTALPTLGRVDPPVIERVLGPAPPLPSESVPMRAPAITQQETVQPRTRSATARPAAVALRDASLARRLSGPAFVSVSARVSADPRGAADEPSRRPLSPARVGEDGASTRSELGSFLEPTATKAAQAQVLPTRRLLLPKGAFLDCTLETAIDSSLPGMTTCITATDTFSADGTVVLLERGSKLVGETRGEVRQGSSRLFILWTEARTPTGVVVPLASPGTDELGRAGVTGTVDRHFWDRFGAAILISVIDGAVQGASQRSSNGSAIVISPAGEHDIMTEVLKSTINIPPTLSKRNGDRIAVLVARDLDFRSVYELRPAE